MTRRVPSRWLPALLLTAVFGAAHADEGMWLFNDFPFAKAQASVGVTLTPSWLDHLRLAAVRIAGGCSASVVSPQGLVMTNHHCTRGCVDAIAARTKRDLAREGFLARAREQELNCPGMEVNRLEGITDVTARVRQATQGLPAERFEGAQRAVMADIERECAASDDLRCEVVPLFHGGRYDLYRYRRYADVRLAFSPEDAIGFFGGDPANFTYPRYDLDVAFLRLYGRDGRPQPMDHWLEWSDGRLREGDPVFVAGNPGGTSRGLTLAELESERDHGLVQRLIGSSESRGMLEQYAQRGDEQRRQAAQPLFSVENSLKVSKGRHAALADPGFMAPIVAAERDFRARVAADPALQRRYGDVWDRIAELTRRHDELAAEHTALERGPTSRLFGIARMLLRHAEETAKPNGQRLREYSDARLPQLRADVMSQRPVYPEYEIEVLTMAFTRLRETLGAAHPVVHQFLAGSTPREVATRAVRGTHVAELESDAAGRPVGGARKALFDGGAAALAASNDSMIAVARTYDAAARAVRARMDAEVEGPLKQQHERLAEARLAVYGRQSYPDATFTLRLSFGRVRGYVERGAPVPPFTTLGGAFEHDLGAEPYALPPSWQAARNRLDLATPLNLVTDNDIIGGNSGSPLVDRDGRIAGLVFDGNLQSLGGDYRFDPAVNRTVAVHSAAILHALDRVYGAQALLEEIQAARRGR